jgi:hypothetical protein
MSVWPLLLADLRLVAQFKLLGCRKGTVVCGRPQPVSSRPARLDRLGQVHLVVLGEQRVLAHFAQVQADKV